LLRLETQRSLRLKYQATWLLGGLYLLAAALSLSTNLRLLDYPTPPQPPDHGGIAGLAALCILIQFAPLRLLTRLAFPLDYWDYLRLHRLEHQVARCSQALPRTHWWVAPADLDAATYTALISIMDHTPTLPADPTSAALRLRLETTLQRYRQHPYPELARALLTPQGPTP
jgi:hypothetical protein